MDFVIEKAQERDRGAIMELLKQANKPCGGT